MTFAEFYKIGVSSNRDLVENPCFMTKFTIRCLSGLIRMVFASKARVNINTGTHHFIFMVDTMRPVFFIFSPIKKTAGRSIPLIIKQSAFLRSVGFVSFCG